MSSPEIPYQPPQESSESFYFKVAQYPTEPVSGLAYFAVQDIIANSHDEVDLSSYRFQLKNLWNVVVLGVIPPQEIDAQIQEVLDKGEPADVPEHVIDYLTERRAQATKLGTWVERHQRPL